MSTETSVQEYGADRQSPVMWVGAHRNTLPESLSRNEGLWRTALGIPRQTLPEAFANLEQAPQIERVVHHHQRDLVAGRVTLPAAEGKGYWEFTRIRDEFYVILTNVLSQNPRTELVPGDGLIHFDFKLSGDLRLEASRGKPLRFNRPSLVVWAQPPSTSINIAESAAPRVQQRMISISMRSEFLIEEFLTSVADLPPPLREFVSNPHGNLRYCQLPLTAEMFTAAARLIDHPLRGKAALIYTEAVTLELICAAVDSFCSSLGPATKNYTERTLRCLQAARSLITQQLCPPLTLRQLSRQVRLSETALTRGFKDVYGETILDFSLRCRMQHAVVLLRDQHLSVDQVSEMVGYSHPTSFAEAFRRQFGLRPKDLRHAGFDLDLHYRGLRRAARGSVIGHPLPVRTVPAFAGSLTREDGWKTGGCSATGPGPIGPSVSTGQLRPDRALLR